MILRHIAHAIRRQDWFVVLIEFVIVVSGIFVGLQVDDWNGARKGRALEREYLERLSRDIRSDLAEFEKVEQVFEIKAALIREIRDLSAEEVVATRAERLAVELDYTNWKALPRIQSATYMELESSGRLILLRNPALRGALSHYYIGYEHIHGILAEPIGDYRRMFFYSLPGETFFDMRLSENLSESDWVIAALENLKSRPGFVDAANAEIAYAGDMIYYLREYGGQARRLLVQIDAALTGKQVQ